MSSLQRGVSKLDRGTLPQLNILINRTAVPVSPDKNMKAAEDFLEVNEVFWL